MKEKGNTSNDNKMNINFELKQDNKILREH